MAAITSHPDLRITEWTVWPGVLTSLTPIALLQNSVAAVYCDEGVPRTYPFLRSQVALDGVAPIDGLGVRSHQRQMEHPRNAEAACLAVKQRWNRAIHLSGADRMGG